MPLVCSNQYLFQNLLALLSLQEVMRPIELEGANTLEKKVDVLHQ